jgi:nitrate reductase gamma subunit
MSVPEGCISCHDHIPEDLDSGMHGEARISDPDEYRNCIGCHGPHDQPLIEAMRDRLDFGKPLREQCGACHDKEEELPALAPEDEACMICHGLPDPDDPEKTKRNRGLCFFCHGRGASRTLETSQLKALLLDEKRYQQTSHALNACTDCHSEATRFLHQDQVRKDCRECHPPHDEKVARAGHLDVACEACHLQGVTPIRMPDSGRIQWERDRASVGTLSVHIMASAREEAVCRRCHFKGNLVGAASMILPAKSLICMPCHASTLSVGDTTTLLTLFVFLGGLTILFIVWFSGTLERDTDHNPPLQRPQGLAGAVGLFFSGKTMSLIKAILFDVVLQRRLFIRSRIRWFIHGLIFLSFLFRFSWGLVALATSLFQPEWSIPWAMLDKNHPIPAFMFDLTGVMIMSGVIITFIRRIRQRTGQYPGLPRQDLIALGLLGGVVLAGFVLEAARIAMAGKPDRAAYAFLGNGLSRVFANTPGLNELYGTIWYIHATLTGAFIAYLPFSRLSHMILAPVVLILNGLKGRTGQ